MKEVKAMKNIIKRSISALGCMLMLGTAASVPVSAAGETLTLTSAQGMPGQTVTLNVEVGCSNNFESLDVIVNWNDKALKAAPAKAAGKAMAASDAGDGYCTVVVYGSEALADGAVATIDFTIPSDAQAGTVYDLSFGTVTTFAIFNGPDIPTQVKTQGGKITVGEGGNAADAAANGNSGNSNNNSSAQTATEAAATTVTSASSTAATTAQTTTVTTAAGSKEAVTEKKKESSNVLGTLVIAEIIALSVLAYFGLGVAFGFLTKSMNTKKGYKGGFLWGFLLSVIGVVIVAVRKPKNAIDTQAEKNEDKADKADGESDKK